MITQLTRHSALTPQQAETLRRLRVTPEQQGACGRIEDALYTLDQSPAHAVTGWALLVDGQPRAFLLLMRAPCLPPWAAPEAALMMSLQVDYSYQHQGLGRACLQALPGAVQGSWPEVTHLVLSVAPDNTAANGLYLSEGWVARGNGHRARVGYERQYVLDLTKD